MGLVARLPWMGEEGWWGTLTEGLEQVAVRTVVPSGSSGVASPVEPSHWRR